MNNIPQTKKSSVGFRNIASSENQNEFQEDVLTDIINIFIKANNIQESINYLKETNNIENTYLINNLQIIVNEQTHINDMTNATAKFNIYASDILFDEEKLKASACTDTMTLTIPTLNTTSKVSLYDDLLDEIFLPESLKVTVTPEAKDYETYSITDNNVYNCFKNNNEYWIRKVVSDESVTEANVEMIIDLPEDIISTRDINSITLNLFPFKSVDILGIYYTLYGDWNLIPSFDTLSFSEDEEYLDENSQTKIRKVIKNSPNIRLDFDNISANRIKIILRQRNSINYNGNKTFCLGIKNLYISYNNYTKETCYFKAKVIFDSPKIIKDIKTCLNNTNELINSNVNISYEFYYLSGNTEVKINDVMPFVLTGNTLIVRGSMQSYNITPNIEKIEVFYE